MKPERRIFQLWLEGDVTTEEWSWRLNGKKDLTTVTCFEESREGL